MGVNDWFAEARVGDRSDRTIAFFRVGWMWALPNGIAYHQGDTIVPYNGLFAHGTYGTPDQHVALRPDAIAMLKFVSEVTFDDGTV